MASSSRDTHKAVEIALEHPVRRRILEIITTPKGFAGNVAALAAVLGLPEANVNYHLQVLTEVIRRDMPEAFSLGESQDWRAT